MKPPPLNPDVADLAPDGPSLTAYDEEHMVTYLRILDAHQEDADWRETSRVVLHDDPSHRIGSAMAQRPDLVPESLPRVGPSRRPVR